MSVPFMFVDGNLTVVLNNKSFQVLPDHLNYKMILEALPSATSDELLEMIDFEIMAVDPIQLLQDKWMNRIIAQIENASQLNCNLLQTL